jgi:hypothetical protein
MTVTPLEYDVCPWPIDPACLTDEWTALAPDVQERALALASSTLYRLSGFRVGGCPLTVRPCKRACAGANPPSYYMSQGGLMPHIAVSGVWVNSCGCVTDCSCGPLCELALPEPVGEIIEVSLDGLIVDPMNYRVDGNMLVWLGDEFDCGWPICQDMAKDLTEPNTFSVTYLNSYPVDALGAYAVGVLAMEYAKACMGQKCRLPSTVSAVTRQGVSFEITSGSFPDGFTGIREVDAFISLWNPQALRQRASVWSPDIPQTRVVR